MRTILASTIVASAEANQIELAIAEIKAKNSKKYDERIALATYAIKCLSPLLSQTATEENILEAKRLLINTKINEGLAPGKDDSILEIILAGGLAGGLTKGVDAIFKDLKGGGVEGMIKRFELNASASLEARSGSLTIGKLLELQPSVFIPSLA